MVWLLSAAIAAGVFQSPSCMVGVCVTACGCALWRRSRAAWATLGLVLACIALGAGAAAVADADAAWVAARAGDHGGVVRLSGRVASFPRTSPYGTRFDFRTTVAGREVTLAMRAAAFDVRPGDTLVCDARIAPRKEDDGYLFASGGAGVARIRARDIRARREGAAWRHPGWPVHHEVRTRIARRLGADAALPLALLLGERGLLDRHVWRAVERLGIAHLLALSGMHLGLIAALAVLAARALGRPPAAPVAVALVGYVVVVGDIVSLSRACLMGLGLIAAGWLLRPRRARDALGGALFVMLLTSPLSAASVGLQLSFVATFAVIVVAGRLRFLRAPVETGRAPLARGLSRLGRATAGVFVVSVAVEILIAPLLWLHFERMSVVGPVATTLFVLPVAVLQTLGVATALAMAGGLDAAPAWLLGQAAVLTREALLAAAARAPEPVAFSGPVLPLYWGGLALVWWRPRRRLAWLVGVSLVAASFAR